MPDDRDTFDLPESDEEIQRKIKEGWEAIEGGEALSTDAAFDELDRVIRMRHVADSMAAQRSIAGLPSGFVCPGCAYDLSAVAVDRCSECGRAVDARDVNEFVERDRYVRGHAGAWLMHVHVAVAAVVVMSAGAALVGREPLLGVVAAFLTSVAFAAPAGLAWLIARFTGATARPAYLTFWARSSLLLHAPWLVIPACTLAAFIAAWIDSVFDGMVFEALVVLGFGIWGLGSLACLLGWFEVWHAARREFGLCDRMPLLLYGLLALVTFCGSAALAFAGGGVAIAGAEE